MKRLTTVSKELQCPAAMYPPWVSSNGLRVKSRSDTTIDLKWQNAADENGGNVKFTLQMKSTGSDEFETVFCGYGYQAKVPNLRPNSNYEFRLMGARNGKGEWGSVINAATEVANPNADDLFRAVSHNSLELVQRIISGAPAAYLRKLLSTHDPMNRTPLMIAALNKNMDVMLTLITSGAEVNVQARSTGKTALMVACYSGCYPAVNILHNKGADWGLKDAIGLNALHHVIEGAAYNNAPAALVKLVAEKITEKTGPDAINEKDSFGWTPLMRAVSLDGTPLTAIKALVDLGADVNAKDKKNTKSILMAAILQGKEDIVQFLLSSKADPSYVNGSGNSCLQLAMAMQHPGIADLLKKALFGKEADGNGNLESTFPN